MCRVIILYQKLLSPPPYPPILINGLQKRNAGPCVEFAVVMVAGRRVLIRSHLIFLVHWGAKLQSTTTNNLNKVTKHVRGSNHVWTTTGYQNVRVATIAWTWFFTKVMVDETTMTETPYVMIRVIRYLTCTQYFKFKFKILI